MSWLKCKSLLTTCMRVGLPNGTVHKLRNRFRCGCAIMMNAAFWMYDVRCASRLHFAGNIANVRSTGQTSSRPVSMQRSKPFSCAKAAGRATGRDVCVAIALTPTARRFPCVHMHGNRSPFCLSRRCAHYFGKSEI